MGLITLALFIGYVCLQKMKHEHLLSQLLMFSDNYIDIRTIHLHESIIGVVYFRFQKEVPSKEQLAKEISFLEEYFTKKQDLKTIFSHNDVWVNNMVFSKGEGQSSIRITNVHMLYFYLTSNTLIIALFI